MALEHQYRNQSVESTTRLARFRRISWGAVIAGTVAALGIQMLLSLLGLAIGSGSIDPMEDSNPMAGLGTGTLIWWALSILIALFAGGWVAGRLAGMPKAADSMLHGALTWCLFTLLSFYLLTSAVGRVVSGVGGVVGNALSLAGEGVASVAPEAVEELKQQANMDNLNLDAIREEATTLLQQTGKEELQPDNLEAEAQEAANEAKQSSGQAAENPQQADQQVNSLIQQIFTKGEDIVDEVDKEAAVNVVMERTGKSRAEASRIVDNWTNTYQQAREQFQQAKAQAEQKAREAGDEVASAVSKAAIFAFFGLLIGLVVAGLGGKMGTPHDIVVEENKKMYA